MPKVLGIDLGTTNSCMAVMEVGEAQVGKLMNKRSLDKCDYDGHDDQKRSKTAHRGLGDCQWG